MSRLIHDPTSLRHHARHLARCGDTAGAQERLAEAILLAGEAGDLQLARRLEAERLLMAGEAREALGVLAEVLRLAPDDSAARWLVAEARRQLSEQERAGQGLELHLCARVGVYRLLARRLPRRTETVLELGAAEGHTTIHLARRVARVIAVEKTPQSIQRARERCAEHSNVVWLQADAFEVDQVVSHALGAAVILVDIGGSTPAGIVMRLASMYRRLLLPRAMVIRNAELNDFAAAVTGLERDAAPGDWRR